MKIIAVLALLAIPIFGQSKPQATAQVIALTPSDTLAARGLYTEREVLEGKIRDFEFSIIEKYLSTNSPNMPCGGVAYFHWATTTQKSVLVRQGWGNGSFNFTEDYRYIVPSSNPVPSSNLYPNINFYANPINAWTPNHVNANGSAANLLNCSDLANPVNVYSANPGNIDILKK